MKNITSLFNFIVATFECFSFPTKLSVFFECTVCVAVQTQAIAKCPITARAVI